MKLKEFCSHTVVAIFVFLVTYQPSLAKSQEVCGTQEIVAELNVEHSIQQPGYPKDGGALLECSYTIVSRVGTRIRISFSSYGVKRHGSALTIKVYNGEIKSNQPFATLGQPSQLGEIYHSTGNILSLKLKVPRSYEYSGFKLNYISLDSCSKRLEAFKEELILTSPGYPYKHLPDQMCNWTIIASRDHAIVVKAILISSETCCDRVQVGNNHVLKTGETYTSASNTLEVVFSANHSVARNVFKLSYKSVSICGAKTLKAERDVEKFFKSPPYPTVYGNTFECWYTVTSPEATHIKFWIVDFGTKTFQSNAFYLWFYDGVCEQNSPFLQLDKANQAGVMQTSLSNVMRIKLKASKIYPFTGFSMRYVSYKPCGDNINAFDRPQSLSSPDYPMQHSLSEKCKWKITSPTNHLVKLDVMYLNNETCCDKLSVTVPTPASTTQLFTQQSYISPGRIVTVDYISHNSSKRSGFNLTFKAVDVCGKRALFAEKDVEQNFQAYGYPGDYGVTMTCWYAFTSPENTRIRLWFDDFGVTKIAHYNIWSYFNVMLYDGFSDRTTRLLLINSPNHEGIMYHSKSNVMSIRLYVDRRYVNYTGMSMRYMAVASCGNSLNAIYQPQTISSPNYPQQHLANEICTWVVTSPANHVVKLVTDYVSNETCCDNLQVKVATPAATTQLSTNQVYTSPGRVATIDFISYNSSQRSGFNLTYSAADICGDRTLSSQLNVETSYKAPAYPSDYGVTMTCWYTITSPENTRIRFWIDDFGAAKIAHYNIWSYFNVGFYDGSTDKSSRFMYITSPNHEGIMYHSKSDVLGIRLYADRRYMNYTGMSIRFMAVVSCGEELSAISEEQTISSPNYPLKHASNQICTWFLSSSVNHVIEITANNISDETCCDYVNIVVPNPANTIKILQNETYTTPGRIATIDFISNNSMAKSGFVLSFKEVNICGSRKLRAVKNSETTYKAPAYPGDYGVTMTCWYTITSSENTRIRFWIDSFGVNKIAHYNIWSYFNVGFYNGFTDKSSRFMYIASPNHEGIMYHSKSDVLGIRLNADRRYMNYTGMSIRFMAVAACGEDLNAINEVQTISSPNFPLKHLSNEICTWVITSPVNYVIKLNASYVSNETCCDTVKVKVLTPANTAQFTTNQVYISPGRIATIDFVSHNSSEKSGFMLSYKKVHVCGAEMNFFANLDVENTLQAPGYPLDYGSTMTCWYTITSPENTRIRFWIDDFGVKKLAHYNIQSYFTAGFYDGFTDASSRFLLIQTSNPASYEGIDHYTKSDVLGIKIFVYKSYVYYSGIRLKFVSVASCGKEYVALESPQVITSPGFPRKHLSDEVCTWEIISPKHYLIEIVTQFVSNETCCDKVQVKVPTPATTTQLSTNQVYKSPGKIATITYSSINSSSKLGFNLTFRAVHVCGVQDFVAELNNETTYKAPAYPGDYSSTMTCWYTITSPENTRIRFWIDDFGITPVRYYNKWTYYSVGFYDGFSDTSKRFLLANRDNQAGMMYHSAANVLGIKLFVYKSYVIYTGIKLRFVAVVSCGEELNAMTQPQSISSPGFPRQHLMNEICTWVITSPVNHVVQIKTSDVSNETCCDNLQVSVPTPSSVTKLYANATYTSPGRVATIDFISHNSTERSGFQLTFKAVYACGGKNFFAKLDTESTFNAPGYPGDYANTMTCWYTITSPKNTRIRFWIDDFGVNRFPSGSSQTQFTLSFYDGFQETNKLFLYINSNKPTDISYHSLSDVLGIKLFATKGYVTYTGLSIRYQAVPSCGDNILAISESQSISSPGYPKQHMTNEICTWVVTSPVNHVVEVTAEDISNETCCDKVTVKAATPASTTQLQTDQVYTSPGRIITIDFSSNNSIQRTGFYLSFRAVDICGIKSFDAKTDVEENFKAPGYPGDYGSSMTCWYSITSPENTRIRFWIDSFGVTRFPSGNGQTYFTISIYDGFSSSDERIGYINRQTSTNIMYHSKSNIVGIKIVVHKAYVTYTGISVRYMAVDSCGNNFNAMDQPQSLSSPNYPEKHAINEICTWVITSPINHVVKLEAENISDESCCDNVTVKVPTPETTTQLQTNQVYTSPGRSVTIDYISHNSSKRAGFQLLFTAENICGNINFMAEVDVITKYKFPAFPGDYGYTMTCWYSITSDKDTRIRFWIDDFGVTRFPSSSYYSIGFYNGFSETSPRFLYIYTQRSKELMYHTKSNILGIKLIADRRYVTYTGMSIRYTSVASCGEDFNAIKQPQAISSPNFPNKHLSNEICTWMITSPTNYVIKIEVKNISLETCCDKVQVKVATPVATTQLSTNQVYTSPGRVATIDFISYNSSQRSGFNLTYSAVHICGTKRFFAEIDVEATLRAPGYPGDYGVSMTCWYSITSSKNTRIRFWIDNFGTNRFPSGSSQTQFTVGFYDGFGETSERIYYFNTYRPTGTMYHSKSNELGIKVYADRRYVTYTGISVRFMAVASCGDTLKATQQLQQLSTPGFPGAHLTNEICYWMITSPLNYVVQMNIKNVSDEACCDKITIKVPSPLSTNSIRTPQVYTTPGRTASITFISHNSSKRVGFNMEFKAVHVCGSIQLFAQSNIESTYKAPGYPIDYGSILTCWYTITSPENTRIRFQVTSFGVVGKTYRYRRYTWEKYRTRIYPRWQYFDVGFYNGFSESSERFLLVKADNQENKIQYTKSNVLGIKLSAQRSYVTYSGITLRFIAVGTCGTDLVATYVPQTINFAGTNFPNMSNLMCEWTIQAPCDHEMKLHVYNLTDDSSKDQLKVTSSIVTILTNNQVFITSSTLLTLNFLSNGNTQETKFNIQYETTRICGSKNMVAEFGKEKTVVESGFPSDLTKIMDCWYTIRSSEGTRIRFKFIDFGNIKRSRQRRSTDDNVNPDFYFWFYDGLTDKANKFLTMYAPQDVNISKISEDNVLSFKMHVNAQKINYTGFHMLYVAVPSPGDEKDRLYVDVRIDYNQTYRILASEPLVAKYLLSEYHRSDINSDIFKQMQDEDNISPEFLENDPVNLTGIEVNTRVNYTWTYKVRVSPRILQMFGFNSGKAINDLSLSVFSELKDLADFVQLVEIQEPTTLSGKIISIRVGMARTYEVHISASLIKKYDFMLHRTNDVGNSVFQQIRAQSLAAMLIQLQSPVYPTGITVTLRANFSLSFDVTLSQTTKEKYHFLVNYTNDLNYALFNIIRNEANFVQLVKFETPVQVSGIHLNIRVNYKLIYDVVLQAQTIQEYNFLINQTNDVSNSVFNKIRIISPSVQLDYYKPAVPSQGMISIRVDRKLIYRISVPDNIKQQYFLATSGINDITQNMFERLRPSIVSLQLYRLEKPGTIGGIRTTIRVNFKGMYHVYLPRPILEKYYLSAQTTNDVSYSLFLTIQSQSNASQLYQIQTNVSLVGTPLSIRVDRHRVYQVYLSDSAIKRFDLLIHGVNDVTTSILQDILKTTRFYQLENVVVLPPPSGVQIMIRVNFSLIYKAYVPQHIKFKYHFLVEGFNDISLSSFSTLRHQFSYVELTTITTPVVPGVIPVRVLVNNKQTYDLYLPRQIRDKYNLKVNVTNDISTNVFIQLRSHSTYAQLRRVDVQEPTPKNVFIVRVGQRTYRVAFSDAEKDKFPLKLGTVNDVTVAMFAKISKDATSIQLAKVDSTVTVKVRVGLKWVYELTLSNRLRQEYNLKVNVTNDVTRSIFTTLQTESSSYKFISEVPADLKNTNTVSIRVGNTWQYNASLSQAAIRKYNLSANATNEISMKTFLRMRDDAVALQLEDVEPDNEFAQCPFGSWTKWFNRDDPSGPCDCETLPELRSENPGMICRYPTALQARLENCKTPFDLTQPNIDADTELGFRCKNENGQECMDYEVRFCCPET